MAETHLEEAVKVGVLDTVLGIALESGQGFDRESGLGSCPGSGLGSGLGWEFDQAPVLGSPQESDQDTAPGKFPVVRGPLGHDRVSGLHRFHLETGCKVSGTPLKCGHERKKTMLVLSSDIKTHDYPSRPPPDPGMGHISGVDPSAQQRPLSQQHCILLISCEF